MLKFELVIYEQTPIPVDVIGIITTYMLDEQPRKELFNELLNRFEWCDECDENKGHYEFVGRVPPMGYCQLRRPWFKRCSYPFVKHQWYTRREFLFNEIRRLRSEIWPQQGECDPLIALPTPPVEEQKRQYWQTAYKLRLELYELNATQWNDMRELIRNWN